MWAWGKKTPNQTQTPQIKLRWWPSHLRRLHQSGSTPFSHLPGVAPSREAAPASSRHGAVSVTEAFLLSPGAEQMRGFGSLPAVPPWASVLFPYGLFCRFRVWFCSVFFRSGVLVSAFPLPAGLALDVHRVPSLCARCHHGHKPPPSKNPQLAPSSAACEETWQLPSSARAGCSASLPAGRRVSGQVPSASLASSLPALFADLILFCWQRGLAALPLALWEGEKVQYSFFFQVSQRFKTSGSFHAEGLEVGMLLCSPSTRGRGGVAWPGAPVTQAAMGGRCRQL